MSPHRPRRGSALLVVLVALALVGVLVTSSLHGALAAAQDARIRRAEHRALDLAEWELAAALGGVRGRALATMPEGERRADTSVVPGTADSVVLGTWRLSRNVLWLVAD
ncbi:MAG TPA: hypothetical protein VFY16_13555, partial [Gemmatimonadaceae bacterium]|nr:hypothetical protein [Gemmatimonadaceae bacterium]